MTPGTLLQDRFEIEALMTQGGSGFVFRARDRRDGARVAVKVLRGDAQVELERFEREGRVLAGLDHPGIVRFLAHGRSPAGEPYIVMEWLDGEHLGRRLARAPITPAESLGVVRAVADALAAAHARGVVHCDLKPANVFLVGGDVARVRVLDFGIATLLHGAEPITRAGALVGTPGYMAPEQARGLPVLSTRTDVFALGCVLFECLTGQRAFRGDDVVALLAKAHLQKVPSVRALRPDLPVALDALLARMMARDPEERFPDASGVVAALDALDDIPGVSSARPERPSAPTLDTPAGASALGMDEQRVVSVVLAGAVGALETGGRAALAGLAAALERHGGHLDVLAGDVLLVTLWDSGSAASRAARACRCALELQERFVAAHIVVVTGRGRISDREVAGSVVDRGALVLRAVAPGTAWIDASTREMIGTTFRVVWDGTGGGTLAGELGEAERPSSYRREWAAFVGRSRELRTLEEALSTCVGRCECGIVLVTGEAGSGKSRLCRELLDGVRRGAAAIEVLTGRADSLGDRAPFGIAGDAIRRAAGIQDGDPAEIRWEKLAARVGRHLPAGRVVEVGALLGEMAGVPFPDAATSPLRSLRHNHQILGDSMRAAWEEWIAAECAARPVVLVLEDLQWGDAATIKLVDATARNLRDRPFLVVALARPEIHTRFLSLWAGRGAREIRLGPLPRKASVELVRAALGKHADVTDVARVVEQAHGNPFYLEELVRAVAAGRGDSLPDTVLGVIEARLDTLGLSNKRILRAASVFGERFSPAGVHALLGGDAAEIGEALGQLSAREAVLDPPAAERDGEALYSFRSALVREAAYATLTEADRALGHRLAGGWLEQCGAADTVAMSEHFVRGGEPARAVGWSLRGAAQALAADDLAAALERVERGRACGAAGEALGALLLVEAEARLWRGDLMLAEQRGFEASALFPPGVEEWFQGLYQAVVAAGKLGHFARIEESLASASMTPAAAGAEGARISYLSACASNLVFGGRYAAAEAALATMARLSTPDALSTALTEQARSFRASASGDLGACLAGLTAATAAFERAGDRRNATTSRVNLAFVLGELGELDGAEAALRGALADADRMGLQDVATQARTNLGYVLGRRGQLDEARRLEQKAILAYHAEQAPRDECLARTYLAQIELLAGDSAGAEREARAALAVPMVPPSVRVGALAMCARALQAQGRVAEALASAGEAYSELVRLGSIEEGETTVRLVYGEALAAAGHDAELAPVLSEAHARLLARAAQISDPVWRERFLTRVPDNARTLAMAGAALDLTGR